MELQVEMCVQQREIQHTKETEATRMLKPLQLKGALPDMNRAEFENFAEIKTLDVRNATLQSYKSETNILLTC